MTNCDRQGTHCLICTEVPMVDKISKDHKSHLYRMLWINQEKFNDHLWPLQCCKCYLMISVGVYCLLISGPQPRLDKNWNVKSLINSYQYFISEGINLIYQNACSNLRETQCKHNHLRAPEPSSPKFRRMFIVDSQALDIRFYLVHV